MWIDILAGFIGGVVGGLLGGLVTRHAPRFRRTHRLSDPYTIIAVDRRTGMRRGKWE